MESEKGSPSIQSHDGVTTFSQLTLQLGLGDFPTRLGGRDGGGAGCIHERPLQNSRPVFHPRRQIALTPSLEVVLAFP